MMSKPGMVALGLLVMIVGTACGMSSLGGAPSAGGIESPTPEPTEAPMLPVPINQGLASLDSYRMTFTNDIYDSVAQERSVSTFVVASDRNADATTSRNETRISTAENEVVSEDVQEQFMIGNQVCQVAAGEAEMTTMSDTAQVMSDLMSQVVDFKPLIENPVYVGQDVVNGVPVRTYTFELRSVGAASEVEVDRADGSYAVAVDGDYLVSYRLDLELRTGPEGDPEAESTDSYFELSLEEINQPVEIAFPPNCQAAESFAE
jgi:hypothetical protein